VSGGVVDDAESLLVLLGSRRDALSLIVRSSFSTFGKLTFLM
jgi:hypothetical protein